MGSKSIISLVGIGLIFLLIATNPTSEEFREHVAAELRGAINSQTADTDLSRALGSALGAQINSRSIEELVSVERENYIIGSVFLVRPLGVVNLLLAAADDDYAKLGGLLICGAGGQFFPCDERSRGIVDRLATRLEKSAPEKKDSADSFIKDWSVANSDCRGLSGDDPRGYSACQRRDEITEKLQAIGYCYGRPEEAGYQMDWHICGQ